MVQQASRGTNQHMASTLQLILLLFKITTAGHRQNLNRTLAQNLFQLHSNLLGQLSGRGNNQSLGVGLVSVHLLGQGYQKGQGFASTGLGSGDNVTSGKQSRNRLLLHGHGPGNAHFLQLLHRVRTHLQSRKTILHL